MINGNAMSTIDKASRQGNRYICRHCGNEMHADVNASINILSNYLVVYFTVMKKLQAS